ncbi:MAG: N-acetylneuraminate synthase family protein [Thermodesulfobacteriota bacterium]|jgi:N-acetylneuraminate synthase|nr:MAG: N-acetylneuraminate synthase family protein [Thermodesulfobacteriota bacterium]
MNRFDFNGVFTYDLANNHQGDLEHALNIINAVGEVNRQAAVRGALKFQFRQLDTFIHPDYKQRKDVKHIPRFMETALTKQQYATLTKAVIKNGMHTMATPFDEESVDLILNLDIEIIKVASCSATDRPLLERITQVNKPVIVSTAGLSLDKIDRLVSFLESKNMQFALMHCVAIYPTPNDKLGLNQINVLKERFPHVPIGFSTHEEPDNYSSIQIAYAKGATLFERHVGMETEKHQLNSYSSRPEQIARWIDAYKQAVAACGGEHRIPASPDEIASLRSLMRGVFVRAQIKKGDKLNRDKVYFAMPLHDRQLPSGDWFDGIAADRDYAPNEPVNEAVANLPLPAEEIIYHILLQVKGMLNNARIHIGKETSVELSHHYGLERFREFGAVIMNCINRKYCKKLVIQLPRQKHPYHFHKRKEETFQLLYGDLEVELDGKRIKPQVGDTILVRPGEWHKFHTLDGAIFEEVSTTHFDNDSFYEDERIARLAREARKTVITVWKVIEKKTI